MSSITETKRIPELDGLRGIAILLVMLYHVLGDFVQGGWLGVDVFFVLSGFLITSLLLKEHLKTGRIDLKAFYVRRILRLLPALILLLITFVTVSLVVQKKRPAEVFSVVPVVLFYMANWARAFQWSVNLGGLNHTWSLSIEEQFYILWPGLLLLLINWVRKPRRMVYLLLFGVLAISLYRALLYTGGVPVERLFNGFDTRSDSLLIGCAVAFFPAADLVPSGVRARRALGVIICAWIIFFAFLVTRTNYANPFYYQGGLTLAASGVGLLLLRLLCRPWKLAVWILRHPILVWVGQISYGLYLWHFYIFSTVDYSGRLSPRAGMILNFALTFAITTLSFYLMERPFLKLKKRFSNLDKRLTVTTQYAGD